MNNSSVVARFWSKVEKTETCWAWKGQRISKGYGRFWVGKDAPVPNPVAHRFAYELLVGPVPDGLQLDHLCRNTGCVRPEHLEPVECGENIRRGHAAKTHCPNGHKYPTPNGSCALCAKAAKQRWAEKMRSSPEGQEYLKAKHRRDHEALYADPERVERRRAQMRARAKARYQERKAAKQQP